MNPEKCDHCHRTKFPILFTFKFFGKFWTICPACCRSLGVLMKHRAPQVVQIRPAETRGGSIAEV